MESIGKRIRNLFLPEIDDRAEEYINRQNIRSVRLISGIIFCVETVLLLVFLLVRDGQANHGTLSQLISIGPCLLICFAAFCISTAFTRMKKVHPAAVYLFVYGFALLLITWAIMSDLRHYTEGEQIFDFFAVLTVLTVFLSVHPIGVSAVTVASFVAFYIALYHQDGASRIYLFGYIMLGILFVVVGFIRVHQTIRLSTESVQLTDANESLHKLYRQDQLTGCRNRAALAEDFPSYYSVPIALIMTDIDYFKQINDEYGHVEGDIALKEAGAFISGLFPDGVAYRYGGDEFLVIIPNADAQMLEDKIGDTRSMKLKVSAAFKEIGFSFGLTYGLAHTDTGLYSLIRKADVELYHVKMELHKNDAR